MIKVEERNPVSDNVISNWYRVLSYIYHPFVWLVCLPVGGEWRWRRTTLELIDPKPGERIAELCCGTGAVTLRMAKRVGESQIVACDLSHYQIRAAQRRARRRGIDNVIFTVQDAANTSFRSSSFDKVVLSDALHEIKESTRKAIYDEAIRLLKPGGRIYLSEPNHPQKGERWGRFCYNVFWVFDQAEKETAWALHDGGLEREVSQAGFNLEEVKCSLCGMVKDLKCSVNGN